jgi:uncharacterized protein YegP (UPF0339 family)
MSPLVSKSQVACTVSAVSVGFTIQGGLLVAAKFEVYKDKAGEFRFRLKAGNGEVIAVGEGYKGKAGALNGIESIKKNAADAEVVDQTES